MLGEPPISGCTLTTDPPSGGTLGPGGGERRVGARRVGGWPGARGRGRIDGRNGARRHRGGHRQLGRRGPADRGHRWVRGGLVHQHRERADREGRGRDPADRDLRRPGGRGRPAGQPLPGRGRPDVVHLPGLEPSRHARPPGTRHRGVDPHLPRPAAGQAGGPEGRTGRAAVAHAARIGFGGRSTPPPPTRSPPCRRSPRRASSNPRPCSCTPAAVSGGSTPAPGRSARSTPGPRTPRRRFAPSGRGRTGGTPRAWAMDAEERLWLTTQDRPGLLAFDPRRLDEPEPFSWWTDGRLGTPDGVWFGGDGAVWAVDTAKNAIVRFDPTGLDTQRWSFYGAPPQVQGPFDIKSRRPGRRLAVVHQQGRQLPCPYPNGVIVYAPRYGRGPPRGRARPRSRTAQARRARVCGWRDRRRGRAVRADAVISIRGPRESTSAAVCSRECHRKLTSPHPRGSGIASGPDRSGGRRPRTAARVAPCGAIRARARRGRRPAGPATRGPRSGQWCLLVEKREPAAGAAYRVDRHAGPGESLDVA